mmetsp:Transcript_25917/g.65991  ORF Transcript_25917/g.65991 Transcript_25917/m.65991 type:complete len:209 (-) Transcript_25917:357-983(-)
MCSVLSGGRRSDSWTSSSRRRRGCGKRLGSVPWMRLRLAKGLLGPTRMHRATSSRPRLTRARRSTTPRTGASRASTTAQAGGLRTWRPAVGSRPRRTKTLGCMASSGPSRSISFRRPRTSLPPSSTRRWRRLAPWRRGTRSSGALARSRGRSLRQRRTSTRASRRPSRLGTRSLSRRTSTSPILTRPSPGTTSTWTSSNPMSRMQIGP